MATVRGAGGEGCWKMECSALRAKFIFFTFVPTLTIHMDLDFSKLDYLFLTLFHFVFPAP